MLTWLLAFLSLPPGTAEWLRRTQAVCFGTDESGLPSAAGWIVLIMGPLSFLSAIIVALPPDVSRVRITLRSSRALRYGFCLIAVLAIVESCWVAVSIAEKLARPAGPAIDVALSRLPTDYPQGTDPAPDFELIDQTGTVRSLSALRGRPVLLSFVFSHCASVCPALTTLLLTAQRNAAASDIAVVLITLDPWRDTPSSLPSLAVLWGLPENSYLLSGTPEQVLSVLSSFRVPYQRDEKNGDIVHPALVYVVGPSGSLSYAFNNPSAEWLQEAIKRLEK